MSFYFDPGYKMTLMYAPLGEGYLEGRWMYKALRIVDFGTTEQEIPDSYYDWFLANATPIETIADKLVKIAENEQKVFERGYTDGLSARTYETWTITLIDGTIVEKEVALL
jgi:GTP-binding protein EngB required for normal cell division